MNRILLSSLLCPLLALASPLQAAPDAPAPETLPGGYQAVDTESPTVQAARAAIQRDLTNLRIEGVEAAYAQVVAGMNFKLVCRVTGSEGPAVWEFIAWHRLDDRWQLTTAKQL